ncbi:MAG TPA: hypothetical protein VEX41_05890 [Candidatus Eisenbacteria bacterium]|nr:hypothetical protein [Candidatus Eisenbacteria bacterium]
MIDYDTLKLTHRHGDTWIPMERREHPDAADLDPERALVRDAVVYRCAHCDLGIVIAPNGEPIEPR